LIGYIPPPENLTVLVHNVLTSLTQYEIVVVVVVAILGGFGTVEGGVVEGCGINGRVPELSEGDLYPSEGKTKLDESEDGGVSEESDVLIHFLDIDGNSLER
jgi:hypothetical protein